MPSDDLTWPFLKSARKFIRNKPQIANGYSEKLTITIWGLERNYYVIGSRDVKTKVTNRFFGSSLPYNIRNKPQIANGCSEKLTLRFGAQNVIIT